MMQKYFLLIFLSVIVLLGLIVTNQKRSAVEIKPKVAVTIFPIYDIVKNIVGDKLETILILKPGTSPHTFDPTPSEVRELTGSQAIFAIGHGLDDWALKLADSGEVREVIVLDKKIVPLYDSENSFDPHYWLSLPNAALIAQEVRDELSQIFPEFEPDFKRNFQAYNNQLTELNQQINRELAKLPNKNIATFHQAWNYFARDHQLRVVATFEEYPGKEPTVEYLVNFEKEVKMKQVKVIFSEPQFSTKPLEPIARDLGIAISTLDPIGGVSGRDSYLTLMQYNTKQITEAIK